MHVTWDDLNYYSGEFSSGARIFDGGVSGNPRPTSPRTAAEQEVPNVFVRSTYVHLLQHFLYFFPLPHGQGSLRPTFARRTEAWLAAVPRAGGGEIGWTGFDFSRPKHAQRSISETASVMMWYPRRG